MGYTVVPSYDTRFIKALCGYLDKISTIVSHRALPIKKDGLVNIIITVLFVGGRVETFPHTIVAH